MPTRVRAPTPPHRTIFACHLWVVGVVSASAAWVFADELKRLFLAPAAPPLLEWSERFHNPEDAALLPYVASALAAFAWGLYLYVRLRPPAYRVIRRLRRTAPARSPRVLAAIAGAQAVLLLPTLPRSARAALALLSLLACAVRRPSHAPSERLLPRASRALRAAFLGPRAPGVTAACWAASVALLVAVSVEPTRLATGPVRLLNEYMYLPERPLVAEGAAAPDAAGPARDPAAHLCELAHANPLEYSLQAMSRGQLNHVGHVLNPLNEYATGKPLEHTYFQYGLGATFLFKWVMDLAGGPSLQAYYRSLLLFAAYALVFVVAALVLFRDARYVLGASAILAAAHYLLGYEALLLAPGINPVLHFLDLPVLLVALRFFRTGARAPLALAAAGAAASIAVNGFFGGMITVALCVSATMHALENAPPGRRAQHLAGVAALLAAPLALAAALLPRTGGADVRTQFLGGFFSWLPSGALVAFTLAYLAGSYLFLLWSRARRDAPKYAGVYLFVYAQGFLVYFYWSGLASHFWPALPYLGLHALLMVRGLGGSPRTARWEPRLLAAAVVAAAILGKAGVDGFVAQRNAVRKTFARWEAHRWPFPRARVVATADPAPIAASLAQIERYSGRDERGIGIVSVFDNLVPFLAERHSLFPHFDLQWSLLTDDDRRRAVAAIERARPRHLFVGREVEGSAAEPPVACGNAEMDEELESTRGRIREMSRVFQAVAGDYERVETGPLLSVYRRREGAQ